MNSSSTSLLEPESDLVPLHDAPSELFSDLFAEAHEETRRILADPQVATLGVKTDASAPQNAPKAPLTLRDSGLTRMQICELILKHLYLNGNLLGVEVAKHARLPFNLVDESLRFLKDEKCIEVSSGGDLIGRASYRFNLTDLGRTRAREAFEQCRYVGPAPVPLEAYLAQCRLQAVAGIKCDSERLLEAFQGMIVGPQLLDELGPAVCSGRSIFIYGPPGNGKSMAAKGLGRFLNKYGGDIYVPYAVLTENSIITIFDPTLHVVTDNHDAESLGQRESLAEQRQKLEGTVDLRWRRVRRPVVITGGELTLDQLELRYNKVSNFYQAPVQMKANGGVFLIDDFGRQIVSPKDLLNRWIVPLEERIDYLTLITGKKFSVPFELLIIFSTNLDPHQLVDEAFLRRIRHKIQIGAPDRAMFSQIFRLVCEQQKVPFDERAIQYLFTNHYDRGRTPRSSDPRDLLEIAQSICRFRNQRFALTQKLMEDATSRFFSQV